MPQFEWLRSVGYLDPMRHDVASKRFSTRTIGVFESTRKVEDKGWTGMVEVFDLTWTFEYSVFLEFLLY